MATYYGTEGDDTFAGAYGGDQIFGAGGDDTLSGGAGHDQIEGGEGDDYVSSGVGRDVDAIVDTLTGGFGDDQIHIGYADHGDGGAGSDVLTLCLRGAGAGQTIDLSAMLDGGSIVIGGGVVKNFEVYSTIEGSNFDDRIVVGDAKSLGDRGDIEGGLENDTLIGGRRANELFGGEGKDELDGLGGAGADRLTGGAGADKFIFAAVANSSADQPDLITDLSDDDLISLWAIDADATRNGNQRFELVSGPDLEAGQAALVYDAGLDRTELRLEIAGAAGADMVVLIAGDPTSFTNFVL